MNVLRNRIAVCSIALTTLFFLPQLGAAQRNEGISVLHAAEAGKLLPDAVYYAGKSASTQLRNSAGVHFADGSYTLAVLVDTSGYSTAIQQKYQGYFLTETALEFGGHRLVPGAYGFGFVGSRFLITDIGGHDVLATEATRDAQMNRPMPLQIVQSSSSSGFQLCSGRDCVIFRRAR